METSIWNLSHPRHALELKKYMKPYTCDGCKEKGFGPRYRCEKCDFDLHEACTFSRIASVSHEFFPNSRFSFLRTPPKPCHPECKLRCDACTKMIKGFVFHCEKHQLDLHPCCLNLKKSYQIEDVAFHLHRKVKGKCMWCKRKAIQGDGNHNGWSYASECGKYHIHVTCVTEMALEILNNNNNNNKSVAGHSSSSRSYHKITAPQSIGSKISNDKLNAIRQSILTQDSGSSNVKLNTAGLQSILARHSDRSIPYPNSLQPFFTRDSSRSNVKLNTAGVPSTLARQSDHSLPYPNSLQPFLTRGSSGGSVMNNSDEKSLGLKWKIKEIQGTRNDDGIGKNKYWKKQIKQK